MTILENRPSKFIEFAYGATASEHESYDCVGMPYFRRGIFVNVPLVDVSQRVPQYRSVQVFDISDGDGVLGRDGRNYIPIGYDFLPFDIDAPDPLEAVHDARKFIKWLGTYGICDYSIFWSGSKGIHVTLPWDAFTHPYVEYTPAVLKLLVDRYIAPLSGVKTFDLSVYNNRGLFRLPNTRNVKTGFYKIELTRDELFNMEIGDIEHLARSDRSVVTEPERSSDYTALNNMLLLSVDTVQMGLDRPMFTRENGDYSIDPIPFVEEYIEKAHVDNGTRHKVSLTLAAYFKARGFNIVETEEALADFMTRCTGSNTPVSQRVKESKNDIKACYARDVRFSYYRAKEIFGG